MCEAEKRAKEGLGGLIKHQGRPEVAVAGRWGADAAMAGGGVRDRGSR